MSLPRFLCLTTLVFLRMNFLLSAAEPASAMQQNIEFAKASGENLTCDLFIPEGKGPFPTCILVHGGGFIRGDKQSYIKPLFEPLGKAGFAWFSINYRLAPKHRWPACAEDVATAIRWVKAHAGDYRVDTNRIALIGESAGGHLVSWVGTLEGNDTRVAAVVPFYAPHDLELQVKHRNMLGESMTALLGLTELNDDAWKRLRDVSPSTHLRKGMPPYLLIHGDKDPTVPFQQSAQFQKQMKALGNTCDLITVPEGVHGMGAWDQLNSPYQQEMVAWLTRTLNVGTTSDESRRKTSDLDRLKELGGQVTEEDGRVTKLFFRDCSKLGEAEFRAIGELKTLRTLTLYGSCKGLSDETLPLLAGLTELEELSTDGIQVTDAGIPSFTALKNLKSLSFFHPSLGMKGFNGSGFAALKALPKLERLTIAGTPFNDAGMTAVAEIKQLKDFRTWHTFQTSAGNEALTKLPELRSLWFGQRLRKYDGSSNDTTLDDSTFDVLVKLKTLESLTLDEARLSLEALTRLKELPKLKRLDLKRIDIPAADIEKLRAALPSVKIDWAELTADEKTKLEAFLKVKK